MTPDTDTNTREDPIESLDPKARARALQSLLVEKGALSTDAIDEVIAAYEEEIGPLNGAQVVARAWTDPDYRERLLSDATTAIAELGFDGLSADDVEVVENTATTHNIVVCTLCSCYPWGLLGLPPTWYKSKAYRSRVVREPRAVLGEFGLDLDPSVDIHVWDSNSDIRYMVLPQRPPDTDGLSEAELVDTVTRNAMIGVERLAPAGGQ
jgi:nitrile hydratase